MPRYCVLVVWKDGNTEYLYEGNEIKVFPSRSRAQHAADFLREGMDVDDAQSVNVVKRPDAARSRRVRQEQTHGPATD